MYYISDKGFKDAVFECFFTIIDPVKRRDNVGPWLRRWYLLCYVVDAGQVLGVLMSGRYGWAYEVSKITNNFDIVHAAINLIPPAPQVTYHVIAQCMVLAALLDAVYLAYLHQQGNLRNQLPVKILRFLVSGTFSTFFTAVLGWMLYPVDCHRGPNTFSSLIHGSNSPCTPFGPSEVGPSLVSILLASSFVAFSVAAKYLSFDMHPLSQSPGAACTGRVEALWTVVRALCVVLGVTTHHLTPFFAGAAVLVAAVLAVRWHASTLPFNSQWENACRGGIYLAVAWAAVGGLVASGMSRGGAAAPQGLTNVKVEWAFVGLLPLIFAVGAAALMHRGRGLGRALARHRRMWEGSAEAKSGARGRRRSVILGAGALASVDGGARSLRRADSALSEGAAGSGGGTARRGSVFAGAGGGPPFGYPAGPGASDGGELGGRKNPFDQFFDQEFEASRLFASAREAHVLVRRLLAHRRRRDIPFVAFLLKRALIEFPDDQSLIVLNVLLMRIFVRACAVPMTSMHEKRLEACDGLALDLEFVLYVADRGTRASDSDFGLGKQDVNAFQMLEFEAKFSKVQRLHRECIAHAKAFWQVFNRHNSQKNPQYLALQVEELLATIHSLTISIQTAAEAYQSMMDSFPSSVTLLRAYASFCDVVLNKSIQASQLVQQAELLDKDSEGSQDDPTSVDGNNQGDDVQVRLLTPEVPKARSVEMDAARSACSSGEGGVRGQVERFFLSWKECVLGGELLDLNGLHARILAATFLIVLSCTLGFSLTDSLLYESDAHSKLNLVDLARLFRLDLVRSLYLTRSLYLAELQGDWPAMSDYQSSMANISSSFAGLNLENFESAPGAVFELYTKETWDLFIPVGESWVPIRKSLWYMSNEFVNRLSFASSIIPEDLVGWTNSLRGTNPSQRAIAFLHENCIANILPPFERLSEIYAKEMHAFGLLTMRMIWVSMSLNVVLIVIVSYYVLRSLDAVVSNIRHQRLIVLFALSATNTAVESIHNYYLSADRALREMDDGEAPATDDPAEGGLPNKRQDSQVKNQQPSGSMPAESLLGRLRRQSVSWGYLAPTEVVASNVDQDTAHKSVSLLTPQRGLPMEQLRVLEAHSGRQALEASAEAKSVRYVGDDDDSENGEKVCKEDASVSNTPSESLEVSDEGMASHYPPTRPSDPDNVKNRIASRPDNNSLPVRHQMSFKQRASMARLQSSFVSRTSDPFRSSFKSRLQDSFRSARSSKVRTLHSLMQVSVPDTSRAPSSAARHALRPRMGEDTGSGSPGGVQVGNAAKNSPAPVSASRQQWQATGSHQTSLQSLTETTRGAMMQQRMESSPVALAKLDWLLTRQQPWYSQRRTHAITMFITLVLCVLSIVYPSRNVGELAKIPVKENQGGRQRFLQAACVYYARELVLADGFSRLTTAEAAEAMTWALSELKAAVNVVRLGGTEGNSKADENGIGSTEFDAYFYSMGCPWRANFTEGATCTMSAKPTMAIHGLNGLLAAFYDAAHAVLAKYAPPDRGDFLRWPANATLKDAPVLTDPSRIEVLSTDPDLLFMMQAFDEDLSDGMAGLLDVMDIEHLIIFEMLHSEGRLLYGIFIIEICVLFYLVVFRSTVHGCYQEADLLRSFIERIPAFLVDREDMEDMRAFFVYRHYAQVKSRADVDMLSGGA